MSWFNLLVAFAVWFFCLFIVLMEGASVVGWPLYHVDKDKRKIAMVELRYLTSITGVFPLLWMFFRGEISLRVVLFVALLLLGSATIIYFSTNKKFQSIEELFKDFCFGMAIFTLALVAELWYGLTSIYVFILAFLGVDESYRLQYFGE